MPTHLFATRLNAVLARCLLDRNVSEQKWFDAHLKSLIINGRGDRIRTCDPHTPSVMRYQAALRPDRPPAE